MMKIVICFAIAFQTACCTELGRPKPRLLFYDEDGNLVKTYSNPYLQNLRLNAGLPIYGNFINPFFGFIKDFGSIFAFTVPVSHQVILQINKDPQYHNQLMVTPPKDPVIQPNALCQGRRAQIPSPNYCSNYLNCWDGWAVEQECPTGLLFSSQGYCDYSDNVQCETRKLREQPLTQPRCSKDFETFRNQLDCNEFFVCVNRQPVKFKCPADLAYNQVLGVCDYPTRVNCYSTEDNKEIFNAQQSSPEPAPSTTPTPITITSPSEIPSSPTVIPPSLPDSPTAPLNPSTTDSPFAPNNPPTTDSPFAPNNPSTTVSPPSSFQSSLSSTFLTGPLIYPMPSSPVANKLEGVKTFITENSVVNTQSWTSTHIASSLQDAIDQLHRTKNEKSDN